MNFNRMSPVPSEQSKQEFRQVEINGNLMRFCHCNKREGGEFALATKMGNIFFWSTSLSKVHAQWASMVVFHKLAFGKLYEF